MIRLLRNRGVNAGASEPDSNFEVPIALWLHLLLFEETVDMSACQHVSLPVEHNAVVESSGGMGGEGMEHEIVCRVAVIGLWRYGSIFLKRL